MKRSPVSSMLGGVLGGVLLYLGLQAIARKMSPHPASSQVSPPLEVHLHRFELQPDKLDEFQQWVQFEHDHHAETLATLEREKMYVEAIFRDPEHAPTTIYWLEVRGANGAHVESSPLPIDKVYDRFTQETLVPHAHTVMKPEYVLIPEFLQTSITAHNTAASK